MIDSMKYIDYYRARKFLCRRIYFFSCNRKKELIRLQVLFHKKLFSKNERKKKEKNMRCYFFGSHPVEYSQSMCTSMRILLYSFFLVSYGTVIFFSNENKTAGYLFFHEVSRKKKFVLFCLFSLTAKICFSINIIIISLQK